MRNRRGKRGRASCGSVVAHDPAQEPQGVGHVEGGCHEGWKSLKVSTPLEIFPHPGTLANHLLWRLRWLRHQTFWKTWDGMPSFTLHFHHHDPGPPLRPESGNPTDLSLFAGSLPSDRLLLATWRTGVPAKPNFVSSLFRPILGMAPVPLHRHPLTYSCFSAIDDLCLNKESTRMSQVPDEEVVESSSWAYSDPNPDSPFRQGIWTPIEFHRQTYSTLRLLHNFLESKQRSTSTLSS
ncbi:hypothetical protein BDV96DRAFT_194794 [Lophiotrema nucula]|uniref:Uncharacterized protein n=1 Tax=Lophiotrema nucula TaxID=690887 RepID=A0A6A5YWT7_9PLEO|nr:hypothetical protein BDV96DRAFT_194794 [Lophiotrema nucula]